MSDSNEKVYLASESWRMALLPATATLQDAIACLDASGFQIAVVVAADGTLIGAITDGDIRRGLLRGLTVSSSIDGVVRRNPLVVPAEMDRPTVLQLMQANAYHAIPVVEASRKVVGLHLLKELIAPGPRRNLMVIMAGGEGTRLRPYTENCPKPLLPVAGKPMLEHIIERARADGIRRFVLAINYLGHMIEEHFGDGARWNVEISYLREQAPLGTAGALGLLDPRPELPLLISNGDVLTDIRFGELLDFHAMHGASATMAVRVHEWQHPFGVVHTKGVDIVGFEEKPIARTHINAGIYVLEPAAIGLLSGEPCSMPALFARLQERGERTIVFPMHEPWLDLGTPAELHDANSKGNESPT